MSESPPRPELRLSKIRPLHRFFAEVGAENLHLAERAAILASCPGLPGPRRVPSPTAPIVPNPLHLALGIWNVDDWLPMLPKLLKLKVHGCLPYGFCAPLEHSPRRGVAATNGGLVPLIRSGERA